MNFMAEIHVEHDDLVLNPTIRSDVDVTVRWEYETTIDGETTVLFVSAFGETGPALETALEDDHTVADPTHIATFSKRSVYRVAVDTDLRLVPPVCVERGAFVLRIVSDDDGWTVRLHLPNRDALLAFNAYCVDNDISFRVAQLHQSEPADDIATAGLTEKQRDLLLTALYSGYYDVPRGATQDDIAEQLGVSASAVSQRIRRAVSQLIVSTLDVEGGDRSVRD